VRSVDGRSPLYGPAAPCDSVKREGARFELRHRDAVGRQKPAETSILFPKPLVLVCRRPELKKLRIIFFHSSAPLMGFGLRILSRSANISVRVQVDMGSGIDAGATAQDITHKERPRLRTGDVEVETVFDSMSTSNCGETEQCHAVRRPH
jgi:hypothetical protein